MDKRYLELLKSLAQATASSAETVMEYNRNKNDEESLKTATTMRDDFQDLTDRISADDYVMTKMDAAKFLIGALVQVNQLQDRIANLKRAMAGYQTDLIPKLQEIVDKAQNDEEAVKLADEKFILEDNK